MTSSVMLSTTVLEFELLFFSRDALSGVSGAKIQKVKKLILKLYCAHPDAQ